MPEVLGHVSARLHTSPLRDLAADDATLGPRCVAFAREILGKEPDPWQSWCLDHLLELGADGRLRFRVALVGAARQNGKSFLAVTVIAWALATGRARLVVGTAQDLSLARRQWESVALEFETNPDLTPLLDGRPRRANGQESLRLLNGCEYIIKASTADAARGLSADLVVLDELRTHRDLGAWAAITKTVSARPGALILAMSNAGDDQSIALNQLRDAALSNRDPQTGIFEWSAPDGCDLDDPEGRAAANPSLGRGRLTVAALDNAQALDPPAIFRTECLNQRVANLRGAVDRLAWEACADAEGTLDGLRDGLHACIELAEGDRGEHATLAVAALREDGAAVLEVVEAWDSYAAMEVDLPDWLSKMDARTLWFYPTGPAAARADWLRKLDAEEIKGAAVQEACMGLAADVRAGQVVHRDDALLTAHVVGAERLPSGDGWRFTRKGAGNVDAAYAGAGAVWAARKAGAGYATRESILWTEPAPSA